MGKGTEEGGGAELNPAISFNNILLTKVTRLTLKADPSCIEK